MKPVITKKLCTNTYLHIANGVVNRDMENQCKLKEKHDIKGKGKMVQEEDGRGIGKKVWKVVGEKKV